MVALIPWIVALATAGFVLAPFFGRSGQTVAAHRGDESWHTLSQLETDRAMGKIDDAEYEELKVHTAPAPTAWPLEAVIFAVRRARRLDVALEAEVLIKRARRANRKDA